MNQPTDSPAPDAAAHAAPTPDAEANAPEPDMDADGAPPPGGYDPADYRWVPVRRRPRDGWTEEKMRRFIETLADTGQVGLAAAAVGLSRESAYRLKRQPHAAAFARAWDAARHHAGAFLEDVAFDRAIAGVAHDVFNEYGEAIATRRVVNDRLLMFLLRHLKPERYGQHALARPAPPPPEPVEASLRELEPRLPAPAEELLGPDLLADELELADSADGVLPHFLAEQRPRKSPDRVKAEARAAQEERGEAEWNRVQQGGAPLDARQFADLCRFIDPAGRAAPSQRRFR
jgi:hypothetical protein